MSSKEWNIWKIGDTGRIVTGKTPPTQNLNNFGDRYPFITPRDMLGQKRIHKTERYLSEEGKTTVKNCLLPANSICVSCIGSDMGKVVMTTTDSVTNQQLNSVICKASFDPDFVYYALVNISDELRNAGHHSTAVPILNKTDFSNFEITAPDTVTQRRIANILSALDDKLELNHQINATLHTIAQIIFTEWFVDFNFPGATGEMVESELGMIPRGWRVGKLGEISEKITKGTTPTTLGDTFVDQGIRFLRAECIQDGFGIDVTKSLFITSETHNKLKRSQLAENDILVTIAGSIGRMGIVTKRILPANLNQAIGIIRLDSKTIPMTYAYYYLKQQTIRNELLSGVTQSVQANISLTDLNNIKIMIPPKHLLEKFDSITRKNREYIENLTEQSADISALRDGLLPKLMSGEIEV